MNFFLIFVGLSSLFFCCLVTPPFGNMTFNLKIVLDGVARFHISSLIYMRQGRCYRIVILKSIKRRHGSFRSQWIRTCCCHCSCRYNGIVIGKSVRRPDGWNEDLQWLLLVEQVARRWRRNYINTETNRSSLQGCVELNRIAEQINNKYLRW